MKDNMQVLAEAAIEAADIFEAHPETWMSGEYCDVDFREVVPHTATSCCLVGMLSKLTQLKICTVERTITLVLGSPSEINDGVPSMINDEQGREGAIKFLREFARPGARQ